MKYIIIVNGSVERYNSGTEIVMNTAHSDYFCQLLYFLWAGDLGLKNSIGNVEWNTIVLLLQ